MGYGCVTVQEQKSGLWVCYCAGIKDWAMGVLLCRNKRVGYGCVTVQE